VAHILAALIHSSSDICLRISRKSSAGPALVTKLGQGTEGSALPVARSDGRSLANACGLHTISGN
jgi:hypothetical protein